MEINLNMAESVYINIWGIGSKHTNSSEFDTYSYYNQISEVISYNRKNYISDYRSVIGDAEKLEKGEYLTETSRLISMCNLIIFYLLHTNLKVIIIGYSHGALIIHGAILKLKMILNDELQEQLNSNRIYIITNGSPRYLPKKLLKKEQIYNIYNINDSTLKYCDKRLFPYFKLPDFKTKGNYINACSSNEQSRFLFIKKYVVNKQISFFKEENYIYVRINGYNNSEKNNHVSGLNLYILFDCSFPRVLNHLLTTIPKKKEIIDFDRILYKIGDFFFRKDYNIIHYLDEFNIRDINSFLNLLSDKDIFQLYFSFKPDIDNPPILASSKIEPVPDGIVIKIKVDKKIKDNLNLLSINQLNILCGNNVSISDIKTATYFITSYNKMIEEIKSKKEIDYNDLLNYLRNYNRKTYIEFLKKCGIKDIKDKIKHLKDDIKISIYISLTLKNLSSLSS
jgi:hypothetical protein